MALRERRGMIIKNVSTRRIEIKMKTRTLPLGAGEERMVSAEEVRDKVFREHLQVRSIAVVRPTTREEEAAEYEALRERFTSRTEEREIQE